MVQEKRKKADDPIVVTDTQVQPINVDHAKLHDEVQVIHHAVDFDGISTAEVNAAPFAVTHITVFYYGASLDISIASGTSFRIVFQPFLGHPLLIAEGAGNSGRVIFRNLPLGTSLDPGSAMTHTERAVRALGRFASIDVTLHGAPKQTYPADKVIIHCEH